MKVHHKASVFVLHIPTTGNSNSFLHKKSNESTKCRRKRRTDYISIRLQCSTSNESKASNKRSEANRNLFYFNLKEQIWSRADHAVVC